MKKHLLLIPSLVALSATPFIGLTSCFESEEDDPTPPKPDFVEIRLGNCIEVGDGYWRMESQPISLIPKNKKVRFIMDLGDFTGVDMLDRFIFFLYDNQQLTLNFSSYCQVYLNNNPVTYDNRNDPDLLDDKSYTYDKYGDIVDDIYLRYSGLTRSDKLCFEFIFNQEYQSQYELKAEVELCPNGELSKPFRTSSELKKRER